MPPGVLPEGSLAVYAERVDGGSLGSESELSILHIVGSRQGHINMTSLKGRRVEAFSKRRSTAVAVTGERHFVIPISCQSVSPS